MARLGINQYGKAETHLVRVVRDGPVHELRDLLVSVALSGALEDVHVSGNNSAVLATDTQKNTVYAFAKEHGVGTPEAFASLRTVNELGPEEPERLAIFVHDPHGQVDLQRSVIAGSLERMTV